MDLDVLNKNNIDNLTRFWKTLGVKSLIGNDIQSMHHSKSWPHRSWFDWATEIDQQSLSTLVSELLTKNRIVPVWGACKSSVNMLEPALLENGFNVSLEQFAMYLELNDLKLNTSPAFDGKLVTDAQDIETWVGIASEAFGYPIDASVFQSAISNPDIRLLLAYCDGEPAGTALLFKTGDVVGVHLVGVAPHFRGQGIAKALMQRVIVDSHQWAAKILTLQASAAGEPMYRQLGFRHQFTLRSYRRQ